MFIPVGTFSTPGSVATMFISVGRSAKLYVAVGHPLSITLGRRSVSNSPLATVQGRILQATAAAANWVMAVEQARIVVSADTDFGELLARDRLGLPSVLLLRRRHDPDDQIRTILDALVDVAEDLLAGAVVVIVEDRIRIRRLPIR